MRQSVWVGGGFVPRTRHDGRSRRPWPSRQCAARTDRPRCPAETGTEFVHTAPRARNTTGPNLDTAAPGGLYESASALLGSRTLDRCAGSSGSRQSDSLWPGAARARVGQATHRSCSASPAGTSPRTPSRSSRAAAFTPGAGPPARSHPHRSGSSRPRSGKRTSPAVAAPARCPTLPRGTSASAIVASRCTETARGASCGSGTTSPAPSAFAPTSRSASRGRYLCRFDRFGDVACAPAEDSRVANDALREGDGNHRDQDHEDGDDVHDG